MVGPCHLVEGAARAAALAASGIAPGAEGFVHLCWPAQVASVRARFFGGRPVYALEVAEEALVPDRLREEDSYGHGAFPHYYGPIPAAAIRRVHAIEGEWAS